ncbi:MAG: class I SAM-dependent methyltransferase [Acidimicrobiia bacterium]
MTEWGEDLAEWWLGEVSSDLAYAEEVMPLALAMLRPQPAHTYLDLGCGEGRLLEALAASGSSGIGIDASPRLISVARGHAPVAIGRLPDVDFIADDSVDGVAIILVMEHLTEWVRLLEEAARVTKDGGVLALVANHPLITAPDSAPVVDPSDGEVLWRWGRYFAHGFTEEQAGDVPIRFHHRTLSELLGAAARAGWGLDDIVELGVGPARASRDPLLAAQLELPRLIGVRWIRQARSQIDL